MTNIPAGWYDDGRGQRRYWDGSAWAPPHEPKKTPTAILVSFVFLVAGVALVPFGAWADGAKNGCDMGIRSGSVCDAPWGSIAWVGIAACALGFAVCVAIGLSSRR